MRRDREGAPEAIGRLLNCLAEHLFDEDCASRTLTVGGDDGAAAVAADYLGMPLKDYWRTAQVEAFVLLRDTLRRDFGLEAPTGQLAAVVGLRNYSTFRTWYVNVTGKPPEIFVWPKRLRPGTGYPTWNRYARRKLPVEDGRIVLYDLAGIEGPPREIPSLGHLDAVGRAKKEARARIHRDKAHLPEHLHPLLDFIANRLFDGVNATQAKGSIRNKQNASVQLKFYLGETVKSYITKRWVEAAVQAYGESELPIDTISEMLGQPAKRTVYRWVTEHTGENPGDFRRIRPLAEGMVDSETWRRAGYDDPEAARAVIAALHAMGCSAVGVAEPGADPGPQRTEGLAARLVEEARKRPMVVAVVAMEALWQDPRRIEECLRAALDPAYRSRHFSDFAGLDVDGSDLAQIAFLAAKARLRKTDENGEGRDVELEKDRVALTQLVFGVASFRGLPSGNCPEDVIAPLKAGMRRLANRIDNEIKALLEELGLIRRVVRALLSRSTDLDFSYRKQAIEMAAEAFRRGLLDKELNFDEYRWVLAAEANLLRISNDHSNALILLERVDLDRTFEDIAIAATVHWVIGVIEGEAGRWRAALRSLDKALLHMEAANRHSDALKVRNSKGLVLLHCGSRAAYAEFKACLDEAAEDPVILFLAMTNLIVSKYYLDLPDELPFDFATFVAVAGRSAKTKAWIPLCTALIEPAGSHNVLSLFLHAERELRATMQILPATIASLFAAIESAKKGRVHQAHQLGIKAALDLKDSQAFGGHLALAAETFLANLTDEVSLVERMHLFLQGIQMPYRTAEQG